MGNSIKKSNQVINLAAILSLFLMVLAGCKKVSTALTEEGKIVQESTVSSKVKVEDGILVFSDAKEFNSTLKALNLNDDAWKDKWETSVGFVSARSKFQEVSLKLDACKTKTEFDNILASNKEVVSLANDQVVSVVDNPMFQSVINADGIVRIGNDYYRYFQNNGTIVLDGSKQKILDASANNITDEKNGVYQISLNGSAVLNGTSTCATGILAENTAYNNPGPTRKSFHRFENNRYATILRDPYTYLPYAWYEEVSRSLHFSAQKRSSVFGYWYSYAAEYAVNSMVYTDSYGVSKSLTAYLTPVQNDWYYILTWESYYEPWVGGGIAPYHPCTPDIDLDCNANSSGTWQAPVWVRWH